jgi:hypothetical protein
MTIHFPSCPKCGYDQSGEIARWESECPLAGRCTECGVKFEWAAVYAMLAQWGSRVDWYSEHAQGWGELLKRSPGTMARLVFPLRFFREINHRRAIRLGMLVRWMVVVFVAMHLVVSVLGAPANASEWGWSNGGARYDTLWTADLKDTVLNTISAVTFPHLVVRDQGAGIEVYSPFGDYSWVIYTKIAWAGVGVALSWSILIGFVFLARGEGEKDWKRETALLVRVVLLSLVPVLVFFQMARAGFAINVITGMSLFGQWEPLALLALVILMIFWQQLIWTHAVRSIWQIKRSFIINIGGCFGSFIGGVAFAVWIL